MQIGNLIEVPNYTQAHQVPIIGEMKTSFLTDIEQMFTHWENMYIKRAFIKPTQEDQNQISIDQYISQQKKPSTLKINHINGVNTMLFFQDLGYKVYTELEKSDKVILVWNK